MIFILRINKLTIGHFVKAFSRFYWSNISREKFWDISINDILIHSWVCCFYIWAFFFRSYLLNRTYIIIFKRKDKSDEKKRYSCSTHNKYSLKVIGFFHLRCINPFSYGLRITRRYRLLISLRLFYSPFPCHLFCS